MSGLDYLSERQWVIYTIEEELGNLERLVASRQQFNHDELNILADCQIRLNGILAALASGPGEEPLPAWLQRKEEAAPGQLTEKRKSA